MVLFRLQKLVNLLIRCRFFVKNRGFWGFGHEINSDYSLKTLFYKKLRSQNFYLMFSQGVIFYVECQQILAIGCNCCLQLATVL